MINKKIGLIILDGIGMAPASAANAFSKAKHPTIDNLLREYPNCLLQASGPAVGLPEGQPGNSEIGHLNIGSGRIVKSELVRINEDVDHNQLIYNPNLHKAILLAKKKNVNLHIIGLASFGGVHSHIIHMLRILTHCGNSNVRTVAHVISDGRDCQIGSIAYDIDEIMQVVDQYPNVKIGTVGGRYYAMDRDQNWDRTKKAIDAMMHVGPSFTNPKDYLADDFAINGHTDEFVLPAFNKNEPDTKLQEGDVVFFINFRQDRARQLCHMFKRSPIYKEESPLWKLNLTLVTMVQYDNIPADIVIYPKEKLTNTLGKILADNGLKQLRIAETEKYAHVTFFFDGGIEQSYKGEDKILIPSPKVATYDLQPEMSAKLITEKLLANMDKYNVVICNYANCDMVGHTGKMDATIKAIETVDTCLAQVVAKAKAIGMTLFITSDHGNCDRMVDNGKPVTAHTTAPVFLVCTDKQVKLKNGALKDIAPLILNYLEIYIPKEMK